MAAKPTQKDGGVVERRLRPIYEWLDNGNNKKALQEAEKVLKKSPSLQTARALRSLALLRLGRTADAHSSLEALAAEKPCDDTTLQAMTISYRESKQLRKVCELYESAVAIDGSEDLYTQLFMAYVRVRDFRAQQHTAVALYKVAPKNPYYFWAVMSIVLQAKEATDTVKKGVLLALAQRMIDKFISENKLEAQQEIRIYIIILQLQQKYEDILKFMESTVYQNLVPGSIYAASLPYLKLLGKWKELNSRCKELLWDNLDRWDYYEPYFDSTFQLMKIGDGDSVESPEKCHEFICQLIENIPSGRSVRGPYLARLELYRRLKEAEKEPEVLMGDALELCVEYVRVFAHKPCCVSDVKPYLGMIPVEQRYQRSREFLTCLGMDEHTMPETLEETQRHVSCVSAWLLCAALGSQCGALAGTLRSHYLRARARGLAPATPTEFPAADTYAVLSARLYYLTALEEQSSSPILEALSLLEFVLKNSPSNFHCKLLALKLYHVLGNGHAADSIYQMLEVKHIQLASLGWLHAARLQPAALPEQAFLSHTVTHGLHTHYVRDSVDHLTYSYKYGTFEKLVELMDFVSKLQRCAWCATAGVEHALLPLLVRSEHTFTPPPHHSDDLTDNRDLTVMRNYDPPHLHNPSIQEETFKHEMSLLTLRSCIVNVIAHSIEIVSVVNGTNAADQALDKATLLAELEGWAAKFDKTFVEFKENYRCPFGSDIISAPFPSRIIAFVNSPVPYRELYSVILNLSPPLARWDLPAAHAQCERAAKLLSDSLAQARVKLTCERDSDTLWTFRERIEELYNYVELIGIVAFELGVCHELAAPQNKRNKKKGSAVQTPAEQRTVQLLNEINTATQNAITFVEEILDSWQEPVIPVDLQELFEQLSLHENSKDPVMSKLQDGYKAVVNGTKSILALKMKTLKSL